MVQRVTELRIVIVANALGRTIDNKKARYGHITLQCYGVDRQCITNIEKRLLPAAAGIPESPLLFAVDNYRLPIPWVDDHLIFFRDSRKRDVDHHSLEF